MNNDEPRACSTIAYLLGTSVLRICGWKLAGGPPKANNMVIIAAPHTSNWDFILLISAAYSFRISINWLGKNTLFWRPLGYLLRFLGGIAVDRSTSNNMVQVLAAEIEHGEGINLVVPPAGTRSKTEYWKSGFYRIAEAAQIPIVCGYLDYEKKEAGLGPSFLPTDVNVDMNRLREFYGPITAKFPENKSRILLREESEVS
ncbi:MAG: acyltransferase [Gammaproteobacteria bacterium]|jgi:1-acyl-sn-glycerol-3-phosphate acyltransferase|nr:acyltransferase [Gammaproteobacteria bacterium]MBT4492986.1 acyltransferase [Gammaproteobacteria bacterium]MBT7370664.1 acyltransferase [Gammaproteobacteria bacterium]